LTALLGRGYNLPANGNRSGSLIVRTYLARNLLGLAFTRQDVQKYQQLIQWLNDTLELLGMAERRYQGVEDTPGNPHR
jgi:hypothetical protein